MAQNRIAPITLRSQSAALFTANFVVINAGGLGEACSILRINNATNRDVFLSFDGTTEHEFLAAGQVLQLDNQAARMLNSQMALWPASTLVYVKTNGGAGTGAIYISGYYTPPS